MDFVVQIQLGMEEEIWKDIDGFEGYYQVSNMGRVKSVARTIFIRTNIVGKTKPLSIKDRIISLQKERGKYFAASLWINGVGVRIRVHRLVAKAFIPNPKNKSEVNHIDGNKENNKSSNLEWATASENRTHAFRIGLQNSAVGEKVGSSTHTDDDVRTVLLEFKKGLSLTEISHKYGWNFGFPYRVVTGRAWNHIKIDDE